MIDGFSISLFNSDCHLLEILFFGTSGSRLQEKENTTSPEPGKFYVA